MITYNDSVLKVGSSWLKPSLNPPGMVVFNGALVTGPNGCYFTGKG